MLRKNVCAPGKPERSLPDALRLHIDPHHEIQAFEQSGDVTDSATNLKHTTSEVWFCQFILPLKIARSGLHSLLISHRVLRIGKVHSSGQEGRWQGKFSHGGSRLAWFVTSGPIPGN